MFVVARNHMCVLSCCICIAVLSESCSSIPAPMLGFLATGGGLFQIQLTEDLISSSHSSAITVYKHGLGYWSKRVVIIKLHASYCSHYTNNSVQSKLLLPSKACTALAHDLPTGVVSSACGSSNSDSVKVSIVAAATWSDAASCYLVRCSCVWIFKSLWISTVNVYACC